MAIASFQLDPNAQSYTDDEIVGKVNAASAQITRADAVDAAAVDMDGDDMVTAINAGTSAITREGALSQADLKIVKTNPTSGEFKVTAIHRQADGKLDIEYDDTAV